MLGKGSAPSPRLLTHRGQAQSRCQVCRAGSALGRHSWLSLIKDLGMPTCLPLCFYELGTLSGVGMFLGLALNTLGQK